MVYSVKEVFYTLQGEGARTGRPAVFCRFAGCNLWSGREADRPTALCRFCDTDFVGTNGFGGGKFESAEQLVQQIRRTWPASRRGRPYVVCTGGEPLLQLDENLIETLHSAGFEVAVETNGTLAAPACLDWVCVSPKAGTTLRQTQGDELKLVYPQPDALPDLFQDLDFQHFYLQPMDSECLAENTRAAVDYCLRFPQWRLSIQTHKLLTIP